MQPPMLPFSSTQPKWISELQGTEHWNCIKPPIKCWNTHHFMSITVTRGTLLKKKPAQLWDASFTVTSWALPQVHSRIKKKWKANCVPVYEVPADWNLAELSKGKKKEYKYVLVSCRKYSNTKGNSMFVHMWSLISDCRSFQQPLFCTL